MWMFCKSGFFSAVEHAENPELIHLRARFLGDLEMLFSNHAVEGVKVVHTPGNDYAYRADVPKADWSRICAEEASDIDYTNFKDRVHDGTARDAAYMGVWCTMRHAQASRRTL